jgi:two-component system, NarL family, nitrate/nitrite response regulator NarL
VSVEPLEPLISVAVVADIRLYRDGLADLLRRAGVDVTATATDASSAVECILRTKPEIALVDLAMPSWKTMVAALRSHTCETRTIALGVVEREDQVVECAEAGIAAYVRREASVDELLLTLASVRRGEIVCSSQMAGILYRRVGMHGPSREPSEPGNRLTHRELEIVDLIDEGLSNKEIARRLTIEPSTVKNHVHHILEKLKVHRRADAAIQVRRRHGAIRI